MTRSMLLQYPIIPICLVTSQLHVMRSAVSYQVLCVLVYDTRVLSLYGRTVVARSIYHRLVDGAWIKQHQRRIADESLHIYDLATGRLYLVRAVLGKTSALSTNHQTKCKAKLFQFHLPTTHLPALILITMTLLLIKFEIDIHLY